MTNNNFQYFHSYLELSDKDVLWLLYHEGRTTIDQVLKFDNIDKFNHIFLVDQEINLEYIPRSNIHIWQPTFNNNPQSYVFLWWFEIVRELHEKFDYTAQLFLYDTKQPKFKFDMLLGTPRRHKDYIYKQINDYGIIDDFVIGCHKANNNNRTNDRGNWVSGGDYENGIGAIVNNEPIIPEITSCILPYKIYNDSWYSIVCETSYKHCFLSEKTAKPILAKRLFVLIGAKHMIKNLQSLGYKTFSNVLDESYDDIDNDELRWDMACEQIKKLYYMDPIEVYLNIQSTLEHNYQLLTETNWWNIMKNDIKGIIR